jgi:antitoxin component HigA of HigAB toxin-antitoxin module
MTEEEYQRLLKIAENLIAVDPAPDSLYGKRLDQVATILEEYEREHFPFRPIARHLKL